MAQQALSIVKKNKALQQPIICLIIMLLSTPQWLGAQQCIDTVQVKGYYITEKQIRRGVSYFVPADSISTQHPLSYWLNCPYSNTQLFMSCQSIGLRHLLPQQCKPAVENRYDTCTFPVFPPSPLYYTPYYSSRIAYEITYLDAWWVKISIDKKTIQSTFVSSLLPIPDAPVYTLYYFFRCNQTISNPEIKDACIVPFPANNGN